MKRIFQPIIVFILLLLVAGCSSDTNTPQQDEPVVEITNNDLIKGEPSTESTDDEDYDLVQQKQSVESPSSEGVTPTVIYNLSILHSTSTWAKTNKHFFFTHTLITSEYGSDGEIMLQFEYMLYRLPLGNITQGERVTVPGDGEIEIVGICKHYVYVSRRTGEWNIRNYAIYRISQETLQATLIDYGIYYGVPRFHRASNSILFAHGDFDERLVWLESLQLDTGTRRIFFEFESHNFDSFGMGWRQLENGDIVFINSAWGAMEESSDFVLIDSYLQARLVQLWDPYINIFQEILPQNPAEYFILQIGAWQYRGFATVGDWVYYLWCEVDWRGNLYRIKPDGTQNMLVQENTNISSLLSVNNTLLATVHVESEEKLGDDVVWHEAVVLSQDGKTIKTLGGGWHGHNSAFGMQRLANMDMVMVMNFSFFWVDGSVQGLFCTATGTLFSVGFK